MAQYNPNEQKCQNCNFRWAVGCVHCPTVENVPVFVQHLEIRPIDKTKKSGAIRPIYKYKRVNPNIRKVDKNAKSKHIRKIEK